MADFNFRRQASDVRQLFAAMRTHARQNLPSDKMHVDASAKGEGCQTNEQILLDGVGGHALLTMVEDSLETMLDVLGEMQSLAFARCRCDGETMLQEMDIGCTISEAASAAASDLAAPADACLSERLGKLQNELRDLVVNTRFDGVPLLDASYPAPPLFIDIAPARTLCVALEPPGPALLSVVSTRAEALSPDHLAYALTDVTKSIKRLDITRSRLKAAGQEQSLAPRRSGNASIFLIDTASARAELAYVGRRISEDAVEAVLAQANAERRLVDFLYRHGSANALTRIYPLGADLDDGSRSAQHVVRSGRK